MELLNLVDKLCVCPGHPESKFVAFIESKKGKLCSRAGEVVAHIDRHAPVCLNGESFPCTVRTMKCDMLIHGGKCKACSLYRRTLRILHDRGCKRDADELSSSSSHTNNRYLNTPEKLAKVTKLRQRVKSEENEVSRLKEKIANLIQTSEIVDEGLHTDLSTIMHDNTNDVH